MARWWFMTDGGDIEVEAESFAEAFAIAQEAGGTVIAVKVL